METILLQTVEARWNAARILLGPAIFAQDKINLHKNKCIFPKIIAYGPSIYIMNHPAFIVCNCREISLVKHGLC